MVVDSTDRARLNLAKEELHRVATDPELSAQSGSDGACLLIFANKQDVKGFARFRMIAGPETTSLFDDICLVS
jgi:ADP-ribosylation factor-like protein 5B